MFNWKVNAAFDCNISVMQVFFLPAHSNVHISLVPSICNTDAI